MEHISKSLEKSRQNILSPKNSSIEVEPSEPEESQDEILIKNLKRFNISTLEHTFANFKATAKTKPAVETLKAVARGESDKKFILLYGTAGCGKTHLIEATIIEWATYGANTYYLTFSEIARRLKSMLGKGGDFYDVLFKSYCDVKRLIVDDYGMGTTESRYEISALEDIIDMRYRRRFYPMVEQVTIMASNKDIKELPDRVTSRFYDPDFGAVFFLGDVDYRRRKI